MQLPPHFTPLWHADSVTADGLWFCFAKDTLLVADGPQGPEIPRVPAGQALPVATAPGHCIGKQGELLCWAANLEGPADALPTGLRLVPVRGLFGKIAEDRLAIAGRALQVLQFHRTHRFCGACASPTELHDEQRARRCPSCGAVMYPRIAPAMMVLVKRDTAAGRELLLARGTRFPGAFYSALAGFVEPSESIEDCIHREVREEVGLRVRNLRYFGSQSWPFPHSLMVAFIADHEAGEILCDPSEIVDARWFPLDGLPPLPGPISISRRLINHAIAEVAPEHAALRT